MASILIGATVLAYDAAHKKILQRRAAKAHNAARFSELEKDNAARIARLREQCACGGDHTAADHPGGPMGDDLDTDAHSNEEGRWRGREDGGRAVRRANSMPAVGMRGTVVGEGDGNGNLPPPPAYEEFEYTARVGEEGPMRKAGKRRFFWRSRKIA